MALVRVTWCGLYPVVSIAIVSHVGGVDDSVNVIPVYSEPPSV
jgi:hypothetical protein